MFGPIVIAAMRASMPRRFARKLLHAGITAMARKSAAQRIRSLLGRRDEEPAGTGMKANNTRTFPTDFAVGEGNMA